MCQEYTTDHRERPALQVVPEIERTAVDEEAGREAIQQPGHCLWRVGKPLSSQAPDE